MNSKYEICIPMNLVEPILWYSADTELSVEEIIESAIKNYLERGENNAER